MSKTILIGKDQKFTELYSINLHTYVGTEMLVVKNYQDALTLLNLIGPVDLIVCEGSFFDENSAPEVQNFLESKNDQTPLIIIGNGKKDKDDKDNEKKDPVFKQEIPPGYDEEMADQIEGKNSFIIENPLNMSQLTHTSAKILNVTARQMAGQIVGDFFPISSFTLFNLKESFCEVYLRYRKLDQSFNYMKILESNQSITEEFTKRYSMIKNEKFFIPSQLRLRYTNKCTELVSTLLNKDNLTSKDRLGITEETTKMVYEEYKSFGLSESVVKLSSTCLKSINKIVSGHPKLNNLLKALLSNQASYAFAHCQLTTYVAFYIIDRMDWGSPEHQEKISFVTFFHDIFLVDDRLCAIRNEEELKKANLTPQEVHLVHHHALQAAELIQDYPLAPIGSDVIIKQHHGARNGIGFANDIGPEISPLSQVFIIAEDFATRLLHNNKTGENKSFKDIVLEMGPSYHRIKQKKLIEILEEIGF